MDKGGVEIPIRAGIEQYISIIQRVVHRIMTSALHDKPKDIPITIIVTYAPHTGYSKEEKKEHWGKTRHTIDTIPKRHMTIWCADANGQLGQKDTQREEYEK